LFDEKKYNLLYITLYTKYFEEMMTKEWTIAIEEISDETFAIAKLNKWIGENIDRMSEDIDDTTRKEIFAIIKEWNKEGLWADAIAASVRSKFNQYTRKTGRIEKVVRTEVTRASNKSQESAYEQSWVVQEKEWFTALDERVAPECAVLHGKKIKVWGTFLKKGDKDPLGNKVTYESVKFPPRHVNCRCTLRPIISRKSLEITKEHFEKKWLIFKT
jgi:SPP1 gp7 family putative phage head morphogenesis protein